MEIDIENDESFVKSLNNFDNLSIGIHVYMLDDVEDDKSLRMVYANNAAYELTGVATENIIGNNIDESFPDLRARGLPVLYANVVRKSEKVEFEDFSYQDNKVIFGVFDIKAFPMGNKCVGVAFQNVTKKKENEKELEQNRLLLNETQKLAKVGGWELDLKHQALQWTDEVFRISEVPDDFKANLENAICFYHPHSIEAIKEAMRKAVENGESFDLELEYVTFKGNKKWVRALGKAVFENGEVVKVYGGFQDITERKNYEKELIKTKERLQEAQEFAHLGNWELDTISGEHPWSDELFRIYGFKPQEFIPTINDFKKIIHPDDKEFMMKVMMESKSNKLNENEVDLRIIRQDKTIWIHAKVRFEYNSSGTLVRIYGVVQDITQRKLSELQLKASEEKFREVAENLGEVIWIREGGKHIYISPAYEEVFGRTCKSLYDNPQSYIDAIHPDDRDRILQAYWGEDQHFSFSHSQTLIAQVFSPLSKVYQIRSFFKVFVSPLTLLKSEGKRG